MAELQHSQIKAKLLETVVPLIDASDLQYEKQDAREVHLLSRAVAATALRVVTDLEIEAAVQSLVDGGADNGLDAIYYHAQTRSLFLVQSKWNSSHGGSIGSGDVLKFLQGVQDLVSLKRERFNSKIQKKWAIIEDALRRLSSVQVVIGYTGSTTIDPDIKSKIDEFIKHQNDTSEMFFFTTITQKEFFQYFVHEAAPPKIDLTVKLAHYGLMESPLKAVYGQVSAADVAEWYKKYGNSLFSGNIRHFLGMKSEVNAAISKTLASAPDNFWYFNNGLTLIVQSLNKQAFGGSDRSVGLFDCSGVTVVNGAQTVGTIGRSGLSMESNAVLQARIIVVQDPDSQIGKEITRASNTQNRIDARNFVALDAEQERIRTELLIGRVDYEYREGESVESQSQGFEFIEAITALACASDEISYVAMAKGYVGGLYADIGATPYKALFNPGTSSKRLWNIVKLARRIDKSVRSQQNDESPVERGIVVHGNRLFSHCVMRVLSKEFDLSNAETVSEEKLDKTVSELLSGIKAVLEAEYPDAYLAPLFKNVSKCTNIRSKVSA